MLVWEKLIRDSRDLVMLWRNIEFGLVVQQRIQNRRRGRAESVDRGQPGLLTPRLMLGIVDWGWERRRETFCRCLQESGWGMNPRFQLMTHSVCNSDPVRWPCSLRGVGRAYGLGLPKHSQEVPTRRPWLYSEVCPSAHNALLLYLPGWQGA